MKKAYTFAWIVAIAVMCCLSLNNGHVTTVFGE